MIAVRSQPRRGARQCPPFPTRRSSDLGMMTVSVMTNRLSCVRKSRFTVTSIDRKYAPAGTSRRASSSFAPASDTSRDRKSTRLNSSHMSSSYAVFCLKYTSTRSSPAPTDLRLDDRCSVSTEARGPAMSPFPYTTLFRSWHDDGQRDDEPPVLREEVTLHGHVNRPQVRAGRDVAQGLIELRAGVRYQPRSEEHTSELQSHVILVCRLLLEIHLDALLPGAH